MSVRMIYLLWALDTWLMYRYWVQRLHSTYGSQFFTHPVVTEARRKILVTKGMCIFITFNQFLGLLERSMDAQNQWRGEQLNLFD